MALVGDAVALSPGSVDVADLRNDKLNEELARTRPEVALLTSKYDLEDVRDKAEVEHEKLLQKLHTEAKLSETRIGAERDCALSHYNGVLRSI